MQRGLSRSTGELLLPPAIFLLAALAVLYPALSGEVIGGHVFGAPPLPSVARVGAKLLVDIEAQMLPFLRHAWMEIRGGAVPLWNPYAGNGAPFLANQQSAALHPFTLATCAAPWRYGLLIIVALRLALAFGGAWLLAREIGASKAGCAVASISFSLSGCLVTYLCYPVSGVLAHLPGVMALSARQARGERRSAASLSALLASSILAGHFEYLPLVWGAAIGCFLASARRGAGARAAAFLASLAGGGLLSAAVLIPSLEYLSLSSAFSARSSGAGGPLPDARVWASMLLTPIEPALTMDRIRAVPPNNVVAMILPSTYYVGALCVSLATCAVGSTKGRRLLALTALAGLLAFRNPVSAAAWSTFPLRMIHPDRFAAFVALGLSLSAALGLDALRDRRGPRLAPLAMLAIGYACVHPSLTSRGGLAWIAGPLAVLFLAVVASRARSRLVAASFVALMLAERSLVLGGFNHWQKAAELFPRLPVLDRIGQLAGHDRVSASGELLFPNVAMAYGLRDTRLYDGLQVGNYVAALGREGEGGLTRTVVPTPLTRACAARVLLLPPSRAKAIVEQGRATDHTLPFLGGTEISQGFTGKGGYIRQVALSFVRASEERCEAMVAIRAGGGERLWEKIIKARHIPAEGWSVIGVEPPAFTREGQRLDLVVRTQAATQAATFALSTAPAPAGAGYRVNGERQSQLLSYRIVYGEPPLEEVERLPTGERIMLDPEALPRARLVGAGGASAIVSDDPESVVIETRAMADARLVLADTYYPGWIAKLDGGPATVEREGIFRAVRVSAGPHRVELRYQPTSYRLGLFLSAWALMAGATAPCGSSGGTSLRRAGSLPRSP